MEGGFVMPENDDEKQAEKPAGKPVCICHQDPFEALPPELQPVVDSWKKGLKKVTCVDCGAIFWTNSQSTRCPDCAGNQSEQVA